MTRIMRLMFGLLIILHNFKASLSSFYLGCFDDDLRYGLFGQGRTLNHFWESTDTSVTIGDCLTYCINNGYYYAGLEYIKECYCGMENENYARQPQQPETSCQLRCSGNSNQFCGGDGTIAIYNVSEAYCAGPQPYFQGDRSTFLGQTVTLSCVDGNRTSTCRAGKDNGHLDWIPSIESCNQSDNERFLDILTTGQSDLQTLNSTERTTEVVDRSSNAFLMPYTKVILVLVFMVMVVCSICFCFKSKLSKKYICSRMTSQSDMITTLPRHVEDNVLMHPQAEVVNDADLYHFVNASGTVGAKNSIHLSIVTEDVTVDKKRNTKAQEVFTEASDKPCEIKRTKPMGLSKGSDLYSNVGYANVEHTEMKIGKLCLNHVTETVTCDNPAEELQHDIDVPDQIARDGMTYNEIYETQEKEGGNKYLDDYEGISIITII